MRIRFIYADCSLLWMLLNNDNVVCQYSIEHGIKMYGLVDVWLGR